MKWTDITDHLICFFLEKIFRYRREVIKSNYLLAFPGLQSNELNDHLHKNYLFLAKVIRQTILGPTRKLLQRRMTSSTFNGFESWLGEKKSILLVFGHIGNWEWAGSHVGMEHPDQVCALYRRIKTGFIDKLMYDRRLTHVNYLVETSQIGELLRLMKRKSVIVLMLADQNPGSDAGIIWADFFGRRTAFANGPETLATKYKLPVVYMNIHPKPGSNYELSFKTVYDGQSPVEPGAITQQFARFLETNIRNDPYEWLWSHRRWKRKAPGNEHQD